MERALQGEKFTPINITKDSSQRPAMIVDIAMIGAVSFYRSVKTEGSETFVTSLYEIDRIIDEMSEREEIEQTIPRQYHDFADVFSKKESDTLPPFRTNVDYEIRLEDKMTLGYCPLYKMSIEELEAARQYILNNLTKGFIKPSLAPFASLIIIVRKKDGGMRLCIDYRKLNAITRKDRYLLPLINELLQRVLKAKFFTKLDIRQGFHQIRMHPDSKDLTTFRTRYSSFKYKVMPFRVTNSPATFQRYINSVLGEYLNEFATAFVDDILIYSETLEDHM
jgi:hypothetical protein